MTVHKYITLSIFFLSSTFSLGEVDVRKEVKNGIKVNSYYRHNKLILKRVFQQEEHGFYLIYHKNKKIAHFNKKKKNQQTLSVDAISCSQVGARSVILFKLGKGKSYILVLAGDKDFENKCKLLELFRLSETGGVIPCSNKKLKSEREFLEIVRKNDAKPDNKKVTYQELIDDIIKSGKERPIVSY